MMVWSKGGRWFWILTWGWALKRSEDTQKGPGAQGSSRIPPGGQGAHRRAEGSAWEEQDIRRARGYRTREASQSHPTGNPPKSRLRSSPNLWQAPQTVSHFVRFCRIFTGIRSKNSLFCLLIRTTSITVPPFLTFLISLKRSTFPLVEKLIIRFDCLWFRSGAAGGKTGQTGLAPHPAHHSLHVF